MRYLEDGEGADSERRILGNGLLKIFAMASSPTLEPFNLARLAEIVHEKHYRTPVPSLAPCRGEQVCGEWSVPAPLIFERTCSPMAQHDYAPEPLS